MDNIIFLHEDLSNKLARYLRRKFGKNKLGSDAKSLIMFFKALRYTLNFYKEVDEESALVGLEFLLVSVPNKDVSLSIFLVLNNKKLIEIKNDSLSEAAMRMFASKLVKDQKVFFHWRMIEEFEENLNVKEK